MLPTGGTCWDRMEGGKCRHPLQRQVSKEDCCAAGPDVGFTEKDMNEYEFFFATALGDGTSCTSCIGKNFVLKYIFNAFFNNNVSYRVYRFV